jgi:ATP-dependent DNA helicase DinG
MEDIFGKGGYLARELKGYEFRDSQQQMAEFISRNIDKRVPLLIEAGTGTGKTLAYLVPAVEAALANDVKVIISTETKALQRQLIENDLPLVQKIFEDERGVSFKYSLCLGGANYPCRRRFDWLLKKGGFSPEETVEVDGLMKLFADKKPFTRFDLRVSNSVWSEIKREGDACNPFRCRFSGKCAMQLAKKEWAESNLLVMNHYLFFTNIAMGKTYLPEAEFVVLDEAHSLEDIASSQFGFEITQHEIDDLFTLLKKGAAGGDLFSVRLNPKNSHAFDRALDDAAVAAGDFFEKARGEFSGYKNTLRIMSPVKFGLPFHSTLKKLSALMAEIYENINGEDEAADLSLFETLSARLASNVLNLGSFIYMGDENFVYWMERGRGDLLPPVSLFGRPVEVAGILKEEVFEHYRSSVLTTATLAVNGKFDFICERLGIEKNLGVVLDSPFDYKNQAVVLIPKGLPDPSHAEYMEKAADISRRILKRLSGRALFLFTSYSAMKEMREMIEDTVDMNIYSQDQYFPSEALSLYTADSGSVLMGTHSFWQGIDLRGDLLKGVIMMKLPFSVPDTPLFQARSERVTAQGKNPFFTLQVPEAVIRFKQGFGRLIRSGTDKGIIAILDTRLLTKSYGKDFIRSLPPCRYTYSFDEAAAVYKGISGG